MLQATPIALLAALLPLGCGPLAEERGHLALSSPVVYFAGAEAGEAATASVAVYNVGAAALAVVALQLGITTGFSVEAPPLPARLSPGDELTLRIRRASGEGVPAENALEVTSDDPAEPSLRVELRAPPVAALVVATPAAIEFGAVASGGSAVRPLTVRNLGLGVARALHVEWATGSSPDFSAGPVPELAPGASAPVEIRYTPRGGGADHAALRLRWHGSQTETVVSLSGHQDLKAPD
jgi:hypothetical protein